MPEYGLEDDHQLKGLWWIPSDPATKKAGTLDLKARDGAFLALDDSFSTPEDPNEFLSHDVLLGTTYGGQPVTLANCFQTLRNVLSFGASPTRYSVRFVYIGCHFQKEQQIKLSAVYVWLHNADEWLNRSGFTLSEAGNVEEMSIEYRRPKEIALHANASRKCSFGFSVYGPQHAAVQKRAEIRQTAYLRISHAKGKSLQDYLETNRVVEAFLSLAINGPVYPRRVAAIHRDNTRRLIDVFYTPVARPDQNARSPHDMVFTYSEVSAKFEKMMRLWFRKWPKLKPVSDIYMGVLYGKEMYMENKFLGMTQILESYHRRFVRGQYQSRGEYLQDIYPLFVSAIPRGLDRDYRESLKARMRYHYEYSLRKRLGDLIERAPQGVIDALLGEDSEAKTQFVKRVVNTRNYFTHYSSELEPLAVKGGEELYWLFVKLRILCEMMFFREAGLSPKEIERFVLRNDRYRQEFQLGRDD